MQPAWVNPFCFRAEYMSYNERIDVYFKSDVKHYKTLVYIFRSEYIP